MAQTTTFIAATGTAAAAMAGGPLSQVFDEMTAIAAIMGLFGGVTMAVSNRETWLEMARGGFLGLGLAVGFGAIVPPIGAALVESLVGAKTDGALVGPQGVAAYSYVIGLAQHLILDRIQRKGGGDAQEGEE
jgi:hypothetical protein